MTLLAVERIKLFSTRSPYWCLGIILAVALLFALLMGLVDGGSGASPVTSQIGLQLGMMVMMVLAALSVTTEYRFNTMKATFVAAPHRDRVLLAKTTLVVVMAAVVSTIAALAAFYLTKALATTPDEPMTLSGVNARVVFGNIAIFAIAACIAVAVGVLVRHSAGAIAILMVWPLLVSNLVSLIPKVGDKISPWLPFTAGGTFVTPPSVNAGGQSVALVSDNAPTPVEGLLVFIATAVVLWLIAAAMLKKRDA